MSIGELSNREISNGNELEGEFELEFEFENGIYLFFIPRGICRCHRIGTLLTNAHTNLAYADRMFRDIRGLETHHLRG